MTGKTTDTLTSWKSSLKPEARMRFLNLILDHAYPTVKPLEFNDYGREIVSDERVAAFCKENPKLDEMVNKNVQEFRGRPGTSSTIPDVVRNREVEAGCEVETSGRSTYGQRIIKALMP